MSATRKAQIAAIRYLQGCNGRTIIAAKKAKKITAPFGFDCRTEFFTANPDEDASTRVIFHDQATKFAEGQLAADVARQICHWLAVDYDFVGVDGTNRSCCENLLRHLKTPKGAK